MMGFLFPILKLGQRPSHQFFIIFKFLSFLKGHIDDLLFVIHDFLSLNKLSPHLKHLRMQTEVREAIAVVFLKIALEILLHVLILNLSVSHLVLDLLQMVGKVIVILLDFFYFDG